jgi:hypothetical protein
MSWMKRLLLLALSALVLGAGCNPKPPAPPPPPAVIDPPADGPLVFKYDAAEGYLDYWYKDNARGIGLQTYVEGLDGGWRVMTLPILPYRSESDPAFYRVQSLVTTEGYLVHYGLDQTPNKIYGGRKFRWKYRFKLHTQENPWRFEAPLGPVEFEVLERFPWEPGVQYTSIDDRNLPIQNILTTAPIGAPPFIGCLQADVPGIDNAKKGIYIVSWYQAAVQWRDEGVDVTWPGPGPAPWSRTHSWAWIDDKYDGSYPATVSRMFHITNGRINNPGFPSLSNRTHEVIQLVYAEGLGPYPKPWEKRYFRLAGRGAGGFLNPDGSVRCEFGEWRLDEITDPAAIAWFDSFRTSTSEEPSSLTLTTQQRAWLWPAGW